MTDRNELLKELRILPMPRARIESDALRRTVSICGASVILAVGVIFGLFITAIGALWVPTPLVLFAMKVEVTLLGILLVVFAGSFLLGKVLIND
jgi:hypothetical protein